jgi:hypothetical protein
MNPGRKIEASKIHILQIKTLQGNIDTAAGVSDDAIEGHRFSFELETGFNPDDKIVGIRLKVLIEGYDENDVTLDVTGSYTHEIIFQVENLNEFTDVGEDEKTRIDAGLGSTLVGIAYSTIRGIIYTRTQGTSLNVVTLPVIDPRELMGLETNQPKKAVKKNTKRK